MTEELALCHLRGGTQGLKHRMEGNTLGGQLLGPLDRLWCRLAPGPHILLLGILRHMLEVIQVMVSGVQLLDKLVLLVQQVLRYAAVHTWGSKVTTR